MRNKFEWWIYLNVLNTKAIQLLALVLKCVDDVECCNSLAVGVRSVCGGVTEDVLEEMLKNTTGLFIDEAADALHATTTSKTPECGFADSLDVVAQNLTVTLGAALSESFLSLSASRHAAFGNIHLLKKFSSKCCQSIGYAHSRRLHALREKLPT